MKWKLIKCFFLFNTLQEQPIQTQESVATPSSTPRKRMSRAEKARLESEELLKSLGVTMESGRQTRSSRRGPVVESPKPEPIKRKQTNTPRRTKKAKVSESDSTDGANHVAESKSDEVQVIQICYYFKINIYDNFYCWFEFNLQIDPAQTEKVPKKVDPSPVKGVEKKIVTDASVSKEAEVEPMQVDTAIESTQSEASKPETSKPAEVVPPSKPIEDLLPAPIVSVESAPTKIVEQPIVLESSGVSAAADTTTAIVIDSDPVDESPQNNANVGQPIELLSSPSDDDSKEPTVTNSKQATISQPDAIVELESSSNEGDTKDELVVKTHEIDSLDLELINSDSSHSANDIQIAEIPASKAVQEQSVPTSTVESDANEVTEVTEIADEPTNNISTNNNNADESVHISEVQQNSVPSTNNQSPIEIPDKLCTTITGKINSKRKALRAQAFWAAVH